MHTTATAQRRLLEALGQLYRDETALIGVAADPLVAYAAGLEVGQHLATELGEHTAAAVNAALIDLIEAVRNDLTTKEVTP